MLTYTVQLALNFGKSVARESKLHLVALQEIVSQIYRNMIHVLVITILVFTIIVTALIGFSYVIIVVIGDFGNPHPSAILVVI